MNYCINNYHWFRTLGFEGFHNEYPFGLFPLIKIQILDLLMIYAFLRIWLRHMASKRFFLPSSLKLNSPAQRAFFFKAESALASTQNNEEQTRIYRFSTRVVSKIGGYTGHSAMVILLFLLINQITYSYTFIFLLWSQFVISYLLWKHGK